MSEHQITVIHNKNFHFTSQIGGHTLDMESATDAPATAPSPKKLMLSSLAGCTAVDVVSILNKMKVSFSHFKIDVEADLTDEHPRIYKNVQVHYNIKVAPEDQDKVKKAVALSEEKYCGVMAMFKAFSDVTLHFHFL